MQVAITRPLTRSWRGHSGSVSLGCSVAEPDRCDRAINEITADITSDVPKILPTRSVNSIGELATHSFVCHSPEAPLNATSIAPKVETTEASGELTPTQKLRRREVLAKYRGIIDALYPTG